MHTKIGELVRAGSVGFYAFIGAEKVFVESSDASELQAYLDAEDRVATRYARICASLAPTAQDTELA
jgi:hypothetical protein